MVQRRGREGEDQRAVTNDCLPSGQSFNSVKASTSSIRQSSLLDRTPVSVHFLMQDSGLRSRRRESSVSPSTSTRPPSPSPSPSPSPPLPSPSPSFFSSLWLQSEISSDPSLQFCGVSLSLALLAMWVWEDWRVLLLSTRALCPGYFPGCAALRPLLLAHTDVVLALKYALLALLLIALVSYAFAACASLSAPASRLLPSPATSVRVGCACVALFWAVRQAVALLDAGFRHNAVTMLAWSSAALLLPRTGKRDALRLTYAACYVWAATLKFNREWLTGAADDFEARVWWFPRVLVIPAHVYVVPLELFGALGLLADDGVVFWLTMAQFVAFHVVSYWVVSWFYPVTCLLQLAFYALLRTSPSPSPPSLLSRLPRLRVSHSALLVLALLCAMNAVPRLMPGPVELTGECREFGLHMIDAAVSCERVLSRGGQASTALHPLRFFSGAQLSRRILCQPSVTLELLRHWCAHSKWPVGVDFVQWSWRQTDETRTLVYNLTDTCTRLQSGELDLGMCAVHAAIMPQRFQQEGWARRWLHLQATLGLGSAPPPL